MSGSRVESFPVDAKRFEKIISAMPETAVAVIGDCALPRAIDSLIALAGLRLGSVLAIGAGGDVSETAGRLSHLNIGRRYLHEGATIPPEEEQQFIENIRMAFSVSAVVLVADLAEDGGTITPAIRDTIAKIAREYPETLVLADSLKNIDSFREVIIKPDERAALTLMRSSMPDPSMVHLMDLGMLASERNCKPVVITLQKDGIVLCAPGRALKIPPLDHADMGTAGAGATSAALAASLATGAALDEAAIFAVVAASGEISQKNLLDRFNRYCQKYPDVVGM